MFREPQIPLFLWIASAILAHLLFAGGADRASAVIGEKLDLRRFVTEVQKYVREASAPVEVTLLTDDAADPTQVDEPPVEPQPPTIESEPAPLEPEPAPLEPTAVRAEPPRPEPSPQLKPVVPAPDSNRSPESPKSDSAKKPPPTLELTPDRRIAVKQHVQDENQEDNPDAEFIGDHANRVKEQTQARITSTDQNDPNPTPGGQHAGADDQPGNADETVLGQADDAPGDPERTPTELPDIEPPRVASITPPRPAPTSESSAGQPPPPRENHPAQSAQTAQAPTPAGEGIPERVASADGTWSTARARAAEPATPGRKARRRRLPPPRRRLDDLLGLGATGLTPNGINLNLTPSDAYATVGQDQLRREREADGERRRSKHRGSWRAMGIERWRSAIENYVSRVKLGNQTALNTAAVPFAGYINSVHNRIHPVFAETFLLSLDSLPSSHPLNQPDISTHLEIVLSSVDGRIVDMGVTKTSGVTAFDIGALESVQRASPFGVPPKVIVSPDGNVYLHWEFHRNPYYACSTYFARPYILKGKPKPAPPHVEPPQPNPFGPREGPPPRPNPRRGQGEPAAGSKHQSG